MYGMFLLLMCNRVNLETCKGGRRLDLKGSSVHNGVEVIRRFEKNEDRLARYVCRLLKIFLLLHKSSSRRLARYSPSVVRPRRCSGLPFESCACCCTV